MADMQKGQGGTVILWIIGIIVVGFVLFQLKGSRDGCEVGGGTPRGMECLTPGHEIPSP